MSIEGERAAPRRNNGSRAGNNSGRGAPNGEEEIASKTVTIQYKRFYVDVKQNPRGRFIKIAETGANHKSRLILSMSAGVKFRDMLTELIAFSDSVPVGPAQNANDGELRTENITSESRRYYLDLKENDRGRFLRVAQTSLRGGRSQIAIPAEGLNDIRDALSELLALHSEGFLEEDDAPVPDAVSIRGEYNKNFYFDAGHNDRGYFVRVSEVKNISGFRTSITIPQSNLVEFRDKLNEIIEKLPAQQASGDH